MYVCRWRAVGPRGRGCIAQTSERKDSYQDSNYREVQKNGQRICKYGFICMCDMYVFMYVQYVCMYVGR